MALALSAPFFSGKKELIPLSTHKSQSVFHSDLVSLINIPMLFYQVDTDDLARLLLPPCRGAYAPVCTPVC